MIRITLRIIILLGSIFSNISSAEVLSFKEDGKETKLTYSTIQELKVKAEAHLKSLNEQITEKKKASENVFNPFREIAKKRYKELLDEKETFLGLNWKCPYWKKCDHCNGGKKTSWVGDGLLNTGPCKKCHRKNKYTFHIKPHPAHDIKEPCGITIGTLLGVGKPD